MDSRTFYLKYRPQEISELDLTEVRQGLEKVLKSGKVPHALLFVGPRGTGKTSAARIIAKAINCEGREAYKKSKTKRGQKSKVMESMGTIVDKKPTVSAFEPCNRCRFCQEITAGSSLDLIEIDAASNRGIDDIRNLREKIKLAPASARYKVYIIDEVHMLTTEAFNALLKTLEEPPAHAVFILCTTAPEKLPKTIISRCLRFNFKKAKPKEIVDGPLKRAVKREKLTVEKGVLEEIARSVDGSFRDAHKILEQLSFAGKKITLKETKELLGKTESLSPDKLLSLLAKKDVKVSLLEIDRVMTVGGDLSVYVQELLERLRQAMLTMLGLEIEGSGDQFIDSDRGGSFSLGEVKTLIQLFSRAAIEMKTNPILQLPLELVVVEWCDKKIKNEKLKMKNLPEEDSLENSEASQNISATPRQSDGDGLEEVKKRWGDLLAGVKPLNHSVEALLRAARPRKIDGEFLTLEVFYKFHKERLETDKCRSVVEEVAGQILGAPIKLRCVLGQKSNVETQNLSGAKTQRDFSGSMATELSDSAEDDIMKTAEEIFGINGS